MYIFSYRADWSFLQQNVYYSYYILHMHTYTIEKAFGFENQFDSMKAELKLIKEREQINRKENEDLKKKEKKNGLMLDVLGQRKKKTEKR